MKRIWIILLIMPVLTILRAESNPVSDYFSNQNPTSFISAMQYCNTALEQDTTQNNIKLQMASLAVMEANRIAAEVSPLVASLDTGGMFQYANLMLAQKNYQQAIDVYQKLNTSVPAWSCPWRHKGEALYRQNNPKEALKAFQMAVETNKEHYDAYLWLARTQYQLKKYKPALKNLETALTLNPNAEESQDEVMSENSIRALHQALLKKTGKKK